MKSGPNEQIIESFEKQLDIFINKLTEEEITTAVLNNFFDTVINNLKNERLINDTIFDISNITHISKNFIVLIVIL